MYHVVHMPIDAGAQTAASPGDSAGLARTRLLERAARQVLTHGFADGSLRAIAAELGTSHRMLSYHFGWAEGFWDAVLQEVVERDQRALAQATDGGRLPSLEETWARLTSAPSLSIFRVLFQLYGEALKDRERFATFLSQFIEGWLHAIASALQKRGFNRSDAMLEARLHLAIPRREG